MRYILPIILSLSILFAFTSCEEKEIQKPDKLISQKKMVKMMADMHLAKAYQQAQRYEGDSVKYSTADVYYSVLNKYNTPDSVFIRSLIYYSSHPKVYEKMYNDAVNLLKEMEPQEKKGLKVSDETSEKQPEQNLRQ